MKTFDFPEGKLTFQVLSDVHLEFHVKPPQINPLADVIMLAGDIGYPYQDIYREFLTQLSEKFKLVLLITGNHEYYDRRYAMSKIDDHIEQICQGFSNIVFLQNTAIRINYGSQSVRFWGGTFWTEIPPGLFGTIRGGMNDYSKITRYLPGQDKIRAPITPVDTTQFHQTSLASLKAELADDATTPLVVITHHLPSARCHLTPKDELSRAYYSDHDDLIQSPITHWITGHDHTYLDLTLNGVRCVRNPFGYQHECLKPRDLVISI